LRSLTESPDSNSAKSAKFDEFLGYFNMVGSCGPKEDLGKMAGDISQFLVEYQGVPSSNIVIHSSSGFDFTESLPFKQIFDEKPLEYYHWKFDLRLVEGRGATIMVSSGKNDFYEIGQFLEIRKDNEVIAYATGFGVETYLTRKEGNGDFKHWTIAQLLPESLRLHGILDTFAIYGALSTIQSKDYNPNTVKELRRISKKVAELRYLHKIKTDDARKYLDDFVSVEFPECNVNPESRTRLDESTLRLDNTMTRYKNTLIQSRQDFFDRRGVVECIARLRIKNDLPQTIINEILQEFFEKHRPDIKE
jgi:hypothetical protein